MHRVCQLFSALITSISLALLAISLASGATAYAGEPDCGPASENTDGTWDCDHPEYCVPDQSCLLTTVNNMGNVEHKCNCV